jgi:hypothetical protein
VWHCIDCQTTRNEKEKEEEDDNMMMMMMNCSLLTYVQHSGRAHNHNLKIKPKVATTP